MKRGDVQLLSLLRDCWLSKLARNLMQALVAGLREEIEAAPQNEGPELASDVEFGLAEEAEEWGGVQDESQGDGSAEGEWEGESSGKDCRSPIDEIPSPDHLFFLVFNYFFRNSLMPTTTTYTQKKRECFLCDISVFAIKVVRPKFTQKIPPKELN